MLTGGTNLAYRNALTAQHQARLRIEVWKGGSRVDTLVPPSLNISGGLVYTAASVNATLQSRVTRQLQLEVHEDLYPESPTDLLSESGTELRAFRGIDFGDGSWYEWQTFRGKVSTAVLADGGNCRITALDRADEVIANGFATPQNSQTGAFVDDEMRRLISDRLPDATFGTSDNYDQLVPALTWEFDPGKALDEMATAISSFWYPLANGDFVVRKYPWTTNRAPIVTLADGPGGIIIGSSPSRSRAGVFNAVTVVGERGSGAAAYGSAEDNTVTSATYVHGPFGRRSKLVQLNTPTTNANAEFAAGQLLKRLKGFNESWQLSIIPDASLELGDVLTLNARNRVGIIQVISSFTIPMSVEGAMTINTRAQVIDQLADQAVAG